MRYSLYIHVYTNTVLAMSVIIIKKKKHTNTKQNTKTRATASGDTPLVFTSRVAMANLLGHVPSGADCQTYDQH